MCPFVNKCDPRCAEHLTLKNITRAFTFCAEHYANCTVYQELIGHEPQTCQFGVGLFGPQRVGALSACAR